MGCLSDIISLSCLNGGNINITSAIYGQYYYTCSDLCCAPNPEFDCSLLVSDVRPDDWVYLLYLCQNQTECAYEYAGSVIDECEEGYVADYMQIFYSCLPGKTFYFILEIISLRKHMPENSHDAIITS